MRQGHTNWPGDTSGTAVRPAGAQALVECGRVLALLRGRFHLSVDDIKELAPSVLRHRIILNFDAHADGKTADSILAAIISGVTVQASAA